MKPDSDSDPFTVKHIVGRFKFLGIRFDALTDLSAVAQNRIQDQ